MIPTNQPMIRKDHSDMIYRTLRRKMGCGRRGDQGASRRRASRFWSVRFRSKIPSLIARKLKAIGVPHNVLNAKYHEREAEIIAQAGRKGAVTIATNMAGRGTDILLGGNPESLAREYLKRQEINPDEATPEQFEAELEKAKRVVAEEHKEVVAAGGLHILGTERHESRRIDNQLRGRAGRQGDPGIVAFRSLARRRPDAYLRGRQGPLDDGMARDGKGRRDRIEDRFANRSSVRRRRSRRATLKRVNTFSNTTT